MNLWRKFSVWMIATQIYSLHGYFDGQYLRFGFSFNCDTFNVPDTDTVTTLKILACYIYFSFYNEDINTCAWFVHTVCHTLSGIQCAHREPCVL